MDLMKEELERQVASSLEAPPELLPFIAELLADVDALGSSPTDVVNSLRTLALPHATTLDVGCGKGAISVNVARELGWHAHGVDAFQPFIDHAKQTASENGVASLCEFTCDDMRNVVRSGKSYDVVIYAAHGPLLDAVPCVDLLRQCVRAGGYIVIDDGFLRENVDSVPDEYESYLPHAETIMQMTAHGDRLIREEVYSAEERNTIDRQTTASIRARAEALAVRHPEADQMFLEYVQNQERECQILLDMHVPATWILQRQDRQ